jgi:phage shock protein A
MGIFSRTRDIFAANMTELLDRSEDPAKMIRMIILEMEETLVEVRASAARCIADGKEMRRALSRLDELQKSWTEKAELALSKEREDLAKAALLERQKAADMAEGLQAEIKVIDETLKGYEGDIAKLQGKLREARARQNAIAARFESAVTRARTREIMNGKELFDLIHEMRKRIITSPAFTSEHILAVILFEQGGSYECKNILFFRNWQFFVCGKKYRKEARLGITIYSKSHE